MQGAPGATFAWRYASLDRAARALRARRVSAVELAEEALASLETLGPRYNAIASITRERALREARAVDRRIGRDDQTLSPLAGIPYGAKDLLSARGAPTTWGTPSFRDRVIDADATAIARLSRKGAVLAAKLAMTELAGGGSPRMPGASLQGSGRNPWDPTRYSGGSSSGSAISVALGLVPYALGSETGGSTLGPAAYCGITGLRPTYGLVPRTGAMVLSWTLDKIGVLARTADECALVLAAIAGPDGHDRTARGRFVARSMARAELRGVRVAYCDDLADCAPGTRAAIAAGTAELRRIAPRRVRVTPRADFPFSATLETIMQAEAATTFADHLADPAFELVDARQLATLRAALEIRARDYLGAQRLRAILMDDYRRVFRECDIIVAACWTSTAQRLDQPREQRADTTWASRLLAGGNLAGLPGVSIPCGSGADGLPVGLQLVGPPRSEPLLLSFASAYQRATDHHTRRPPEPR